MKSKLILAFIYLLSFAPIVAEAQWGLQNGGMEFWRRKQFRCCGRNVDLPSNWGTPEQSCGINFNKFVFLEEDTHNIHSGRAAALLYSDTSFFNDVVLQPGMLVYGGYQDPTDSTIRIGQPVENYGYPVDSNPAGLQFWLKMSHDLSDTFSYMYLLTRWDSTAHREDTLAFSTKDVPDTHVPMDQYFQVLDTIQYLHPGHADSVKMIFYGGRFGNPALATNQTWIDDIVFTYTNTLANSTGIAPESPTSAFALYPNPVANTLRIQSAKGVNGESVELYDDLGRMVSQNVLYSALQTIDISYLAPGTYICRIVGTDHLSLFQGKVSIIR